MYHRVPPIFRVRYSGSGYAAITRPFPSFRRSLPWPHTALFPYKPLPDPELPLHGYYVIRYHTKMYFRHPVAREKSGRHFHLSCQSKMYHRALPAFFRVRYSGSGYAATTSTSPHRFFYTPCTTRIQLHLVVWIDVGAFFGSANFNPTDRI
jgi:hypothetical protein